MENNEFKQVCFKNHTYYYFDEIINFKDFDFDVLINEKLYSNILVYGFLYKTLIGSKPLRIRFDRIDGCIRDYDGNRYLALFVPEKYDASFINICKNNRA